ncbi:MAG: DJ-1/PfpI family protein [Terracidiphilus sp.]|jgi:putative intracellular protease/amidase
MRSNAVHLFVFDTMADWEAAFAVAAINNPQFQEAPGRFLVVTVGLSRETITTMGGIRIQPDAALSEISPDASRMLILPGGEQWEFGRNAAAIEMARRFIAHCVPVAAICAATLALARAGLLDNRYHTSNAREYLASSGYRGGRWYRDVPAVSDQGVITASGVASVDFAREIFECLNLFNAGALEAWYALFKYGDVSRYYELEQTA